MCGATSIPEWIEFAGKTMKVEKNKENRLQRCRVVNIYTI